MLLSVVVKVTSLLNTTAPEYVWVPEVVIDPPRSDVPVIVNSDEPAVLEIVPSRSNVAKVCVD